MRLVSFFICLIFLFSLPASAADSDNTELQGLIGQLKELTSKARQQRAADRWLLNDLEDLTARYDWPWKDELLTEDLADGNYNQDPHWQVLSGQFWVDGRLGLRSRTQPAEPARREAPPPEKKQSLGNALFGALLKEALRDDSRQETQPEPERRPHETAEIQLEVAIPKVFAAHVEFSVHNRPSEEGRLVFGILQSQRGSYGYQLSVTTGTNPYLELALLRRGRSQVINSVQLNDINDGNSHTMEWHRNPNGQIEITMDDTSLIKTQDNTFKDSFRWLSVANHSGDFAISAINLQGGQ